VGKIRAPCFRRIVDSPQGDVPGAGPVLGPEVHCVHQDFSRYWPTKAEQDSTKDCSGLVKVSVK
jgi:hypothetical protein